MSGTGESNGDFDDDQRGTSQPAPDASADYVFAEVAGATAMPEEVPDGLGHQDDASDADSPGGN